MEALSKNYNPWVDEIYVQKDADRLSFINTALKNFSSINSIAADLCKSLTDPKEFTKPIVISHLHFASDKVQKPGQIQLLKFSDVVVGLKHTRLPMILAFTSSLPQAKSVAIGENKTFSGIKQLLSYTDTLSKMNTNEKLDLLEATMDGIRSYREEHADQKTTTWISDYLESGKDFKFLGFVADLPYINIDPSTGDTRTFWMHAWGTPQLLFSHHSLPIIMIIGPSLRLDENVLGQKNMVGFAA